MSEEERIQNLVDTAHYYQRQYSDEVNHTLDLQQRIQQLKHLREIAIDVEACLEPGGPVPEFMRLAFADAITKTGEAPEKEGEDG